MVPLWLSLGICAVLGVLLLAQALLLRATRQQLSRLITEGEQARKRIEQLGRELSSFQQGSMRIGEELVALREQVRRLEDKQQRMDQRDPQSLPYNQAARLVGMGASIEDLTQSCGLSKAEAELVVKLHSRQP